MRVSQVPEQLLDTGAMDHPEPYLGLHWPP
jgi:hypothetical protein